MKAPGFDLAQRVYDPEVKPGDVVTEEHRLAVAALAFFAASVTDMPPERLRLGHLVAHLRRGAWHPLREA